METLDGNTIAGQLHEVFGQEMTDAELACAACGAVAAVAETVVYPNLPGTVVRCRSCQALLIVITKIRGISCVDLPGIRTLTPGTGPR